MVPREKQGREVMKPEEYYGARGFVLWILGWGPLTPTAQSLPHLPQLLGRNRCRLPAGKRHGQHGPGQVCTWTRGLGVNLVGVYSKAEGLGRLYAGTVGLYSQYRDRDEDRSGGQFMKGPGPRWLVLLLATPLQHHLQ